MLYSLFPTKQLLSEKAQLTYRRSHSWIPRHGEHAGTETNKKKNKYDRSTPHFAPRMRGHVAVVASAWTPAVTVRADNFRFSFTLNDMSTSRPTNRSNHQYHGNTQWAEWFRTVLYLVWSLSQWLGSFPRTFLFHFRHFYLNYTRVFDKPSLLCLGFSSV